MAQGGKRVGAGRKSRAQELGLAELLDRAWPNAKRIKFFSELAKLAENPRTVQGMEAGKLLAAYTYGKPTERNEQEHSGSINITIHYADTAETTSGAAGNQE